MYQSETSTCRDRLSKYCAGNGLDIGFGGDPIVPHAICLDRPYGDSLRAKCGNHPTHIVGDAWKLSMFTDNSLDFIYQSHTLEDAYDTEGVLREWIRVIKPGGYLVNFLPDEPTYAAHCRATGQPHNDAHVHSDMGPKYIQDILDRIGLTKTVHSLFPVPNNAYSFDLVAQKL